MRKEWSKGRSMKEAGKSAECGTRLQADKSVALRAERRAGRVARREREKSIIVTKQHSVSVYR